MVSTAIMRAGRVAAKHPRSRRIIAGIYRLVTPGVAEIREGPAKGLKIRTRSANPGYRFGTSEPLVQKAIVNALSAGDTCFDLGANVGFFTMIAAQAVGARGKVYAFEPAPNTAAELRANIAMNHLSQITVIEAAVTDSVGEASFVEIDDNLQSRLAEEGRLKVKIVSVDSLGLPAPDLIKIDVEGAEKLAITGMRSMIERHRPTSLCEVHVEGPAENAAETVKDWLPEYDAKPLESGWFWAPHVLAIPQKRI